MSEATAVREASWGQANRFRPPLYDSWCFARLPATLLSFLGRGDDPRAGLPLGDLGGINRAYHTVVLLFVDSFGWTFFERFAADLPFLQRFHTEGSALPITAQFPSTTACHVTCIHTGQPVGKSGVFEWFYYEPLVGAVIAPLPFARAGDKAPDTLRSDGVTPADLFPPLTFYQDLASRGVHCEAFQHRAYTPSTYSNYFFEGCARVNAFDTTAEALTRLAEEVLRPEDRSRYLFLYLDSIDHQGHVHGPSSSVFAAECAAIFTLLEKCFFQKVAGRARDTLLVMTADHGQVDVDPKTTVQVNELPIWPRILKRLRVSPRDGQPILFGGSCRDLFLYVEPDGVSEVVDLLANELAGRAEVWRTDDLIAQGLFGPQVTARLRDRLGSVVVLPYAGESVYYREPGKFDMRYHGHHGGLVPAEMDTGVYLLPLGKP